ncbi:MAG: patatin-like phospholipase family protein [Proteobacteria bacterium]|nr:patatin-like phospholipase family protein [Pseudomonadota bacterium]
MIDLNTVNPPTALILGGGGARAAYQVGVLKGLAKMLPRKKGAYFPIISGTSAGSINAAVLAADADNFHQGVDKLVDVWSNFEPQHVFRTKPWNLASRVMRWGWSSMVAGDPEKGPHSLLDNSPLRELLSKRIDFDRISTQVSQGYLSALCITACSYTSSRSTSFFVGNDHIKPWHRAHRGGLPDSINVDHLMASSSIPLVFPPVLLNGEYFGDGSMRQNAPISPALHLGASKVLIIGLRIESGATPTAPEVTPPGLGQIAGYVMDTLFHNALYSDIERLERINSSLEHIPDNVPHETVGFKPIEHAVITPSVDMARIAEKHYENLPKFLRGALRLIGMERQSSRRFISYLMFEKGFCRELIKCGQKDALEMETELLELLKESS